LVLALLVLAGCVSVPTSGPVEKVEGQQPACQNCVNVEVAPPAPGESARKVVEGFLLANANFQPNYSVARQFLTREAAQSWSSDQGVTIYTGGPEGEGSDMKLTGTVVGALAKDRTFSAREQKLSVDFKLVREDGEWRISKPLPGLFVTKFAFDNFYERYDVYFVGSAGALVPDSIYLPDLRAPANVASALVKALLAGPSNWLAPAVRTAVPPNTTLSVDSVTLSDGVAQVPLSDTVQQLPDPERTLLAAQLVYTLKQVIGVKKVLVLADSRPIRVRESEQDDLAVPVDEVFGDAAPVPAVSSEDLYVVRGGAVQRVGGGSEPAQGDPLPGPLGRGGYSVDALAVSVDNDDLALVTDGRTVLRRAPTAGGAVSTVVDGVTGLLRPQLTRNRELWALGSVDGRQRFWVITDDGPADVTAPVLQQGPVRAFRVSPDGSRIALLVGRGSRTTLGVARINRSDGITIDGWRPLDTSTPLNTSTIATIRDVTWSDASTLMVLGAANQQSPYVTSRVSDDAAELETEPQTNDWDARTLAVLLRTGAAVVVSGDRRIFRDDGVQWTELLDGVTAVAYPG
jgi:Lipoprotein LpqB beta-propeller domain/Sporulation and spore germination